MSFCKECGTKNADGSKFCEKCGSALNGESAPTSAPAPQPQRVSAPSVHHEAPKKGGFFSFRTMISSKLLKLMYVLGMIAITLGTAYAVMEDLSPNIWFTLGGFVISQLIWRVTCEGFILFFSINDILASIERELKSR
ncbi:MAG: DUF4282 domain-containing protein [Clostridia bacterium]|nr:DUF4282 domain-containing protein [Clostridia bacterium]